MNLYDLFNEEEKNRCVSCSQLLFETAKLQSGYSIDNPTQFAEAINRFVSKQLGVEGEAVSEFEEGEAADASPEDAESDGDADDGDNAGADKDEL